ncbi:MULTISPECIES: AMP-binding protein [Hydrocarboniphaga]|uniref:AMP-dependent synthetase and ligase n=1 Tax=Hydrocarboniphaga effusa AP103 TaxID=1172194 RepID=I7ZGA7_9GAMM|nr:MULTISPECIES: AMP-binding protein [Hydrocarboniphaga]EIT70762.1 hypothetical protein WQQ_08990 [Hydrocarboniphaga effusa AP103]MDZ4079863.1 AMP-binding protein [Hydrocarboniphaga sp.]
MSATLPAHHAERAARYRQAGWWSTQPVPRLLTRHALSAPGNIALTDGRGSMRYDELERVVQGLACALWALGLRPGDVLAIQLPNQREFAWFQQAAARIGVAYLPLTPNLRAGDLHYQLETANAAALVIPSEHRGFDHVAMAAELRERLPKLREIFVVGERVPAWARAVDALVEQAWEQRHGAVVDALRVDADALRAILFTSGTESNPKGVLHSWNTLSYPLRLHRHYFGLGYDDAIYTPSPVGHGTGAIFGVELALFVGARIVFEEQWNAQTALQSIAREKCTMMWGATTFYTDLVAAAQASALKPARFRYAFSAGAPIPRDLVLRVRECLGARLVAAFGQSEGQNITINRADDGIERITSSDGRFNPGIDYRIVDAEGRALPTGEPGEIVYRGPNVCLGYLDAGHTAAAFDDEGYIRSGDLGIVDADGYLRIVGRRKEIIIRGGENISPREIEDLLYRAPGVAEVAVIGLPDERLGQRACAVVVPAAGAAPTLAKLIDFLRDRQVAKFKYPERLELVSELPRTASGKVRKEVLRKRILGEAAS